MSHYYRRISPIRSDVFLNSLPTTKPLSTELAFPHGMENSPVASRFQDLCPR